MNRSHVEHNRLDAFNERRWNEAKLELRAFFKISDSSMQDILDTIAFCEKVNQADRGNSARKTKRKAARKLVSSLKILRKDLDRECDILSPWIQGVNAELGLCLSLHGLKTFSKQDLDLALYKGVLRREGELRSDDPEEHEKRTEDDRSIIAQRLGCAILIEVLKSYEDALRPIAELKLRVGRPRNEKRDLLLYWLAVNFQSWTNLAYSTSSGGNFDKFASIILNFAGVDSDDLDRALMHLDRSWNKVPNFAPEKRQSKQKISK